jgi:Outer membrane protein beta-barrel domain
MKKFAIATLLSAFIATPALADNFGPYVVADFGVAKCCNLPNYNGQPDWSNPSVFRISGGYHFSPWFALELGISSFGESNGTANTPHGLAPATLSLSSFQVAAVASLPLSRQFGLIGKLGMTNNYERYWDATGGYGNYSQSDLLFGLGAEIHINPQLSLRALYEDDGKFDNFDPPVKATSVTFGMVYDFY